MAVKLVSEVFFLPAFHHLSSTKRIRGKTYFSEKSVEICELAKIVFKLNKWPCCDAAPGSNFTYVYVWTVALVNEAKKRNIIKTPLSCFGFKKEIQSLELIYTNSGEAPYFVPDISKCQRGLL